MSYPTVIIVHGLLDSHKSMEFLKKLILQHHPGTEVVVPAIYEHLHSLTNLWTQVAEFGKIIKSYSDKNPNGINIIGFSQGGLIARGVIQTFDDLNINSFIALASPLNGQFGNTSYIEWLPSKSRKIVSYLFYTSLIQQVSVPNYWKDPRKMKRHGARCAFLAPLNNESSNKQHRKFRPKWKDNFIKINNLVLIGGPDDDVITPWQSSFFGEYDKHLLAHDMEDIKIYKEDVFGLKTLNEAGKVHKHIFPGIKHIRWHRDELIFMQAIKPYLH